jgi:ubiquinone/menaquinone biosynthesis C-methylase UbiE
LGERADKMERETYWSRFANDFEERNYYVAGIENINAIIDKLRECAITGNVLELGCGNGTYSKVLSETAENVYATDFSDEMVEACKSRLKSFENITVEKQNCFNLSYNDKNFDAIVMINLLHVIPNPEQAVKEAIRVLKPEGDLIVISFCMEDMSFLNKLGMIYRYMKTYGKPPQTAQKLTVATARELIRKEGLKIKKAHLIGNTSKAVFVKAGAI